MTEINLQILTCEARMRISKRAGGGSAKSNALAMEAGSSGLFSAEGLKET